MLRSAASKVVWLGKATTFCVGLAVILALVFGVATTALAGTGVGAVFNLGRTNTVNQLSSLVGSVSGAVLKVDNDGSGPALDLKVGSPTAASATKTTPPMKVDSGAKVANLNADKVDGKDFGAFDAREVIDQPGPLPLQGTYTSKGGTLIISASGSGFRSIDRAIGAGMIGMGVTIDGNFAGAAYVYTNDLNSHRAFVERSIVVRGLPAGTHTIRLTPAFDNVVCGSPNENGQTRCTDTNGDDQFSVTVEEIPN